MFVKFQKHLEKNFPQIKDQNILLALSGGLDRLCYVGSHF